MFLFYDFLYVFFDCKCKSLKRLGENIKQNKQQTYTLNNINNYNNKNKHNKQHKHIINNNITTGHPAPIRPRINISQVPAGRFMFFRFSCFFVFLFFFELFCFLFMFSFFIYMVCRL